MDALLVGAGAVGQVYGRHLAAGGAKVTFYVKPTHREELRQALPMYPLNGKRGLVRFGSYDVVSSPDEVRGRNVDQIWLCVPTTAVAGNWLEELMAAAPKAKVVTLQPGLDDHQKLEKRVGKERLVTGLITMISWHAPLPNEKLSPAGTMYWLPPMAPNLFDGPEDAVNDIVKTLRKGKCGAGKKKGLAVTSSQGEALLQPLVVALEAAGWSWKALREGPVLHLGIQAVKESMTVAAAYHATKVGVARFLIRPWVLKLVLRLAPKIVPFDIETYFQYHFTKVGAQTRLLLDSTLREAEARGLPHAALRDLQHRITKAS